MTVAENLETDTKQIVKGMLYLPQGHSLDIAGASDGVHYEVLFYDPELVDDANLNYKFLIPTLEPAQEETVDFILGFSSDLNRVILGYENTEGKIQAFTAHQQSALFTEYFLKSNLNGEGIGVEEKTVVKSLLLSNQVDNIIKKIGGNIEYSHSGYEFLTKALAGINTPAIGLDDRNTVILNQDKEKNGQSILEMVSKIVANLHSQNITLFDKLISLQINYNLFGEKTFNVASGSKKLFDRYRTQPPADIIHEELVSITDYKKGSFVNLLTNRKGVPELEEMNLVQLDYSSGLRISVEFFDKEEKMVLHLSGFTFCYDKSKYKESRKTLHDRLLKIVVALGKM